MGGRDSSVAEHQIYDWKIMGLSLSHPAAEISPPESTFSADSYFAICSTPMLPLVILPKVQVASYSLTHMHPMCAASSKITL